jgi:hypothetical protein
MIPSDDSELPNGTDQTVSGNLIPPILGLLGIGLLACAVWIFGLSDNSSGNAFSQCAAITDDRARLGCYDQHVTPLQPAKGAVAPLHTRSKEDSQ